MQIRQSIPYSWRSIIKNQLECTQNFSGDNCIDCNGQFLLNLSTKYIYNILLKKKSREPASIKQWTNDFPKFDEANIELWSNIFKMSFRTTRETKLQSFQFQIIHRIIACKTKLYQWKIVNTTKCDYCTDRDDILHFFLYCPKVKDFWNSFFPWWNRSSDVHIFPEHPVLEECIIFGFQQNDNTFEVLDYCVLHAKFFIYRNRLFNKNKVDFYDFLIRLKYSLQVEKTICENNNEINKFKKFEDIFQVL